MSLTELQVSGYRSLRNVRLPLERLNVITGLIIEASERSQIWVTTHSPGLAAAIRDGSGVQPVELRLKDGETVIE